MTERIYSAGVDRTKRGLVIFLDQRRAWLAFQREVNQLRPGDDFRMTNRTILFKEGGWLRFVTQDTNIAGVKATRAWVDEVGDVQPRKP